MRQAASQTERVQGETRGESVHTVEAKSITGRRTRIVLSASIAITGRASKATQ